MVQAGSTLMAFFKYNTDHKNGRTYLYQEFPAHYTYNAKQREWRPRQRGFAIGRIYHCNPFMGEKYYLRMLLTVVRGPQSFEDICTVAGVLHTTFKAACTALGLLEDDHKWVDCFMEATVYTTGIALRILFTTALIYGAVTD